MIAAVILSVLVLLLLGALAYGGYVLSEMVCRPKVYDTTHEKDMLKRWNFDYDGFVSAIESNGGRRPFRYHSDLGYELSGWIVEGRSDRPFKDGRKRIVVLCHGYTNNSVSEFSYARIYYNLGFTLVFYDHRWHGDSDKVFCSMSHYEAHDLAGLVNHLSTQFPSDSIWGIHGESMGSATLMTAAPDIPCLSFCVEDCGFTSMVEELGASMRYKFNMPGFPLVPIGSIFIRRRFGFDPKAVRPIDRVPQIKVPMLFVHGDADRFVPTAMVHRLYDQKVGAKRLHIFEGCTHAKSVLKKPGEYEQVITSFLKDYKFLDSQA